MPIICEHWSPMFTDLYIYFSPLRLALGTLIRYSEESNGMFIHFSYSESFMYETSILKLSNIHFSNHNENSSFTCLDTAL